MRRRAIDRADRDPMLVQREALFEILRKARGTEFGREHGFERINTVEEYQCAVPLRCYEDFKADISFALSGEPDTLWPGVTRYWAK